jgi:hypothetical protein
MAGGFVAGAGGAGAVGVRDAEKGQATAKMTMPAKTNSSLSFMRASDFQCYFITIGTPNTSCPISLKSVLSANRAGKPVLGGFQHRADLAAACQVTCREAWYNHAYNTLD